MVTLTTGANRLLRSWLVVFGAAAACGIWTLVGLFVVNRLPAPSGGQDPTAGAIRIALALILISLGVRTLYHHGPDTPPSSAGDDGTGSRRIVLAFALGLGAMISNVTSLVLFLPAVHDISHARIADVGKAVAFTVLIVVTLLAAIAPPLGASVGGRPARNALDRLSHVIADHHNAINAGICFVFAVFLGVTGVARL
jgi:hypothetical protein